jgi:hypothetical protein
MMRERASRLNGTFEFESALDEARPIGSPILPRSDFTMSSSPVTPPVRFLSPGEATT